MLIWELSKCLRVDNSGDIALCAYTGLVTDTGRFQYQNADSRAFASASEMITAGVDASFVSREVYQNRSEASVLLEACSIKRMKLFCGGQAAISYVTRRDFEMCHAVKADSEALIDTLRSIAGVRVACMLREQGDSIRGGHKAAAGFSIEGPIEGALVRVEKAIEQAFK